MGKRLYLRRGLFIVVAILASLLVFCSFSVSSFSAYAYGTEISTAEELYQLLLNLNGGVEYDSNEFVIGANGDIDFSDNAYYAFEPVTLSNRDAVNYIIDIYGSMEIKFCSAVKNAYNVSGEDGNVTVHYGLFKDLAGTTDVYISYKAKFVYPAGSGIENVEKYYVYGYESLNKDLFPTTEGYHWTDENGNTVTTISYDSWGPRTFTAVLDETVTPEPEPEPEPSPKTYEVIFEDSIAFTSSLTYTEGTALSLPVPTKNGFQFLKWTLESGETVTEIPANLTENFTVTDGKIHLKAEWKLSSLALAKIENVTKEYGSEVTLQATVSHDVISELDVVYEWHKQSQSAWTSLNSQIILSNVSDSDVYSVTVTATHSSSGLSTSQALENVVVTIAPASVTAKALDVSFTKIYDGTVDLEEDIINGVHYELQGILAKDKDDISLTVSRAVFNDCSVNASKIIVEFTGLSGEGQSNYVLTANLLQFSAQVTPKTVSVNKLSSPSISKVYDGTLTVNYDFKEDMDFAYVGVVSGDLLSVVIDSKYNYKDVASATHVRVTFDCTNANYVLDKDYLDYAATITTQSLELTKTSEPKIEKTYDGTNAVKYTFTYGFDFKLQGIVGDEIVGVDFKVAYTTKNASNDNVPVVVTLLGLQVKEGATLSNYSYNLERTELYYEGKILPFELELSGEEVSCVYSEEDELVYEYSTGVLDEKITVEYIRKVGENVGEYEYLDVRFANEINGNYNLTFIEDGKRFNIIKAMPTVTFPTFKEIDFDATLTLWDLELDDVTAYSKVDGKYIHVNGEYSWTDKTLIPSAENTGYTMMFVPYDTTNYDYSDVSGYNAEQNCVYRVVSVSVIPLNPTPTEIDDSFDLAVGSKYKSLVLPEGWSLVESEELSLEDTVSFEVDSTKTFKNALVYRRDDSHNYTPVYKDLVINAIASIIIYKMGESTVSGGFVDILRNPNGQISVSFLLLNPFEKVGYKVKSWTLPNASVLKEEDNNSYYVGAEYLVEDDQIITNEIVVEIELVARDDISVTFEHYYENLEGEFNLLPEERIILNRTADELYTITEVDVLSVKGFSFKEALLNGKAVESFNVSPNGSDVVSFFYTRNNVSVEYVDTEYGSLSPIGTLPPQFMVKYGVPFAISVPSGYVIYGYHFVGYTDGLTFEDGGDLKIFENSYTVLEEVSKVTLTVVMNPNDDTEYVVHRYFDDIVKSEIKTATTGTVVDLSCNLSVEGYVYVENDNEALKGIVSGYLLGDDGKVTEGKMLELRVYYKAIVYTVEVPDVLGLEDISAKFGDEILLPDYPLDEIPAGKIFAGWSVNGKLYGVGESFTMPSMSVVIEPVLNDMVVEPVVPEEDEVQTPIAENKDTETENKGINLGVLFGVLGGVVAVILLLGVVVFIIERKRRDKEILLGKLRGARNARNVKKS